MAKTSKTPKTSETSVENLSYEEALTELEGIVESLEGEQNPLEDSMKLFERGQALVTHCGALLESAQLKVQKLAGETISPFRGRIRMNLIAILENKVLIAVLIGWMLAQALKIPTEYLRSRRWMWAMIFAPGGMPSSHSALMVSGTLAVGLYYGFDNPLFGIACCHYHDRRPRCVGGAQAGRHARGAHQPAF